MKYMKWMLPLLLNFRTNNFSNWVQNWLVELFPLIDCIVSYFHWKRRQHSKMWSMKWFCINKNITMEAATLNLKDKLGKRIISHDERTFNSRRTKVGRFSQCWSTKRIFYYYQEWLWIIVTCSVYFNQRCLWYIYSYFTELVLPV